MGLCLSYTATITATITAVKRMGIEHDKLVLNWTKNVSGSASIHDEDKEESRDSLSDSDTCEEESEVEVVPDVGEGNPLPSDRAIIINWDKNVKPKDMRQVKSLHHFHSIATVSHSTWMTSNV